MEGLIWDYLEWIVSLRLLEDHIIDSEGFNLPLWKFYKYEHTEGRHGSRKWANRGFQMQQIFISLELF